MLLFSKHPFRQCVVPVKCMSLVMYCVIIIEDSLFNDCQVTDGIEDKEHVLLLCNSFQEQRHTLLPGFNDVFAAYSYSLSSETWIIQNLDNLVSRYFRDLLDLPISATLSTIILSKHQFGLSLELPSTNFYQCKTVQRNILKSSPNENIRSLRKNTCEGSNIQYDLHRNTKKVLKAVRTEHTQRMQNELTSQGATLSFLIDNSLKMANSLWSSVESSMPRKI